MEEIKFWIARDEDETDEDGNVINQGSLHIFFSNSGDRYFGNSRNKIR